MKIITRDKKELSMEECTELLQISKTSVQNLLCIFHLSSALFPGIQST